MATQAREDNGLGGVPLQSAMRVGSIRYADWVGVGHAGWIINRGIVKAAISIGPIEELILAKR